MRGRGGHGLGRRWRIPQRGLERRPDVVNADEHHSVDHGDADSDGVRDVLDDGLDNAKSSGQIWTRAQQLTADGGGTARTATGRAASWARAGMTGWTTRMATYWSAATYMGSCVWDY
jgi:hypothetical protein